VAYLFLLYIPSEDIWPCPKAMIENIHFKRFNITIFHKVSTKIMEIQIYIQATTLKAVGSAQVFVIK